MRWGQLGRLERFYLRMTLYLRGDKFRCIWCGRKGLPPALADVGAVVEVPLTIEHLDPRSAQGTDEGSNIFWACEQCNNARGHKDPLVFAEEHSPPYAPVWDILRRRGFLK